MEDWVEEDIVAASQRIWGPTLPADREITLRWLQGFEFCESEPAALRQRRGGPCGVIAAVQVTVEVKEGVVLKALIYPDADQDYGDWRNPTEPLTALVEAMAHMLCSARPSAKAPVRLVTLAGADDGAIAAYTAFITGADGDGEALDLPVPFLHAHAKITDIPFEGGQDDADAEGDAEAEEEFVELIAPMLLSLLPEFKGPFGVLLFLYSMVLTRGLAQIEVDQGYDQDTFVSTPFGHANQCLVNLMLTGQAVMHVWDGDRDAGGLVLKGIQKRGSIGFLSLHEAYNYCHVGEFLKNPKYPIWVIGSETHFTTLFSLDRHLVYDENPVDVGRRVFEEYSSGRGFIETKSLEEILGRLGFDTSPATLERLASEMSSDGIIMGAEFLSTLYPNQTGADVPANFTLYHYNGIAKPGEAIRFCQGQAKSVNPMDIGQPDIMRCLRTKWNPLEVTWADGLNPAIT